MAQETKPVTPPQLAFEKIRQRMRDHFSPLRPQFVAWLREFLLRPPPRNATWLRPLRELIEAWRPLIDAGLVPFAQWGDGWRPMCFDVAQRRVDGECPVVWMDDEALVLLGAEECRRRETVATLVQPLYNSCREFLLDVFGRG